MYNTWIWSCLVFYRERLIRRFSNSEWRISDKMESINLPIPKEAYRKIVLENVNCQSIPNAYESYEKSLYHIRITLWQTEIWWLLWRYNVIFCEQLPHSFLFSCATRQTACVCVTCEVRAVCMALVQTLVKCLQSQLPTKTASYEKWHLESDWNDLIRHPHLKDNSVDFQQALCCFNIISICKRSICAILPTPRYLSLFLALLPTNKWRKCRKSRHCWKSSLK